MWQPSMNICFSCIGTYVSMPDLKATGHSTHTKSHPTANSTENTIHYKAHFYFRNHKELGGGRMQLFKPWHRVFMIIRCDIWIDNISPSLLWNGFIYSKEFGKLSYLPSQHLEGENNLFATISGTKHNTSSSTCAYLPFFKSIKPLVLNLLRKYEILIISTTTFQ